MSEEEETDLSEWELASTKKMVQFSFGTLISSFMIVQFNLYVFYYYEVEIGLSVVLLFLAFIIFAIWNMVNDPLLGYLTDRPFKWTRKWGWRFPWIIIASPPLILCWFLIYAVPENLVENGDQWTLFLYFVILSCLFDTFFSLYTTHLSAGFTTHFRTDAERRRASVIALIVPTMLNVAMGITVPLIYVYGDRSSMILAQTLVVFMLIICVLILIPGIRESEDLKERFFRGYESTEKASFFKTLKTAFNQRNFVVYLFVFVMFSLANTLWSASGIYFMKDVLRLSLYYGIFVALATISGLFLFIPFWMNVIRKRGHVTTLKLGLILSCVGFLPGLWMTTLLEAVILSFFRGIFTGAVYISLRPVLADVNDENTLIVGKHQEGALAGIRTFFFRFALIFQAFTLAIVHYATGYNPDPKAIQTPLAIWGIRIHMALIPFILALIGLIVMLKWYDLEKEKTIVIKQKLKQLRL